MNPDEIIRTELEALKTSIINRSRAAGQRATGKTEALFEVKGVTDEHGEFWGALWTYTLEKGRAPSSGKGTSSGGDFVKNLKEWIVVRGIPYKDERDLERLAKFFAWYVNKFGTKLYKAGGRTDIYTPPIEQFLKNVREKFFIGLATEFSRKI